MAAFLNSHGGTTLIVGVLDDGNLVGIEAYKFENDDKMLPHLDNLLKDKIGAQHLLNVQPRFDEYQDKKMLVVECLRSKVPVFVKDCGTEKFFVRAGASTMELSGSQTHEYVKQRFAYI